MLGFAGYRKPCRKDGKEQEVDDLGGEDGEGGRQQNALEDLGIKGLDRANGPRHFLSCLLTTDHAKTFFSHMLNGSSKSVQAQRKSVCKDKKAIVVPSTGNVRLCSTGHR